jgi:uncharacterized protein (DUF488 family)
VLDVRQRRGVRGAEYAWANAKRLEAALGAAGIGYRHEIGLAPTTALREAQYAEDAKRGVGKRSREALSPAYVDGYIREVLDRFDLGALVRELPRDTTATLLCVEREPAACHRSLIARRLAVEHATPVVHLRP